MMEHTNSSFGKSPAPANPFDVPALSPAPAPPPHPSVNPFDTFSASPPPVAPIVSTPPQIQVQQGTNADPFQYAYTPQRAEVEPIVFQPAQSLHQSALLQQPQQQHNLLLQPNHQSFSRDDPQHNTLVIPTPQQQYGLQQTYPMAPPQLDSVQRTPALDQTISNPFAPAVAPISPDPFGQAIIPVVQQSNPWASQTSTSKSVASQFDPYAVVPAPAPPLPPVSPQELVAPPSASPVEHTVAAFPFDAQPQPQNHQSMALVPAPASNPYEIAPEPTYGQIQRYDGVPGDSLQNPHGDVQPPPGDEMVPYKREDDLVPYQSEPPPASEHVNKYSHILAGLAPPDAAPLPKGEKVIKTGYILARISFRTILLKKWKQAFWVQYGLHTMMWFRNHADFDDWLNNPYHTQQQRNFLVKLAVNFVHDLYKPNVRGYQVTQSRSKLYGKKYLKQFKLERWMDYGPTIAAAFASEDDKEVDELRRTIVDCMRNTPLGNGIRATGAVRQDAEQGRPRSASFGAGDYPRDDAHGGYPSGNASHASEGHSLEGQRQFDFLSGPPDGHENFQQDSPQQLAYPQHQGQHPQQQAPHPFPSQQAPYQQQSFQNQPYRY